MDAQQRRKSAVKTLRWAAVNSAFLVLLYSALVKEISGAQNLAVFVTWVALASSFATLLPPVQERMRSEGRPVPCWLDDSFDAVVVVLMVWHGWLVVGAVYAVHSVIVQFAREKAEGSR
jgi:hypothetical protein